MVRVISGKARGAHLRTPKGMSTRPTLDRVKESLFNILGDVAQAAVLDLYAGSGQLGIEALSRGAKFAVFVESDARAAAVIRANLAHTKLEAVAAVIRAQVPVNPERLAPWAPFDLVFMDPPYGTGQVAKALTWLDEGPLLAPGARVVVERVSVEEIPGELKNLKSFREKVYGDTVLNLFVRAQS